MGSTSSKTGAQEGTSCSQGVSNSGNSSHAGEADRVSPAAPSGHSQKQQGVAGRFWNFILKHLCCRLPNKKCQNKVRPMYYRIDGQSRKVRPCSLGLCPLDDGSVLCTSMAFRNIISKTWTAQRMVWSHLEDQSRGHPYCRSLPSVPT